MLSAFFPHPKPFASLGPSEAESDIHLEAPYIHTHIVVVTVHFQANFLFLCDVEY